MSELVFSEVLGSKPPAGNEPGSSYRRVDLIPAMQEDMAALDIEDDVIDDPGYGVWVAYPQDKVVRHFPNEDDYFSLLTARNNALVSPDEQSRLREAHIAVIGLSVGSSALMAMAQSGIGNFTIADGDRLSPTNLNRLHASAEDVGRKKADIFEERIAKLNPFINVLSIGNALEPEEISDVLDGETDVVVDAVDSMPAKASIRISAQELGVAVGMATDLGTFSIIELEPHDQSQNIKPFGGRVKAEQIEHMVEGDLTQEEIMKYMIKIVGVGYLVRQPRLLRSVLMLKSGKLAGIPQLGTTAGAGGNILAATIRDHILKPRKKYYRNKHNV